MAKLPSFQFYPADWLNDINLKRVSFEVKGFLIDLMCLMHQSPKYGYLTKDFENDLPVLLGKDRRTSTRLLAEVEQKLLVKRDIATGELFNKRMVHDEHVRQVRRDAGKKGGDKRRPDLLKQNIKEKQPPSSSSSSSSSKRITTCVRFDDFWSIYPVKADKKKCLAKWKSRGLDSKADTLIEDVENRIENHKKWIDGFVCNPLTYINGDKWDDEIEYKYGKNGSENDKSGEAVFKHNTCGACGCFYHDCPGKGVKESTKPEGCDDHWFDRDAHHKSFGF